MAPSLRAECTVLHQVSPQWRLVSAAQVKHSQFEITINVLNTFWLYKTDDLSLLKKDAASCIGKSTRIVSIKKISYFDLYVHFDDNIDHLPSHVQLF